MGIWGVSQESLESWRSRGPRREGAGAEKGGGYPTSMCPGTFLMRRSRISFPMICSGVN